MMDESCKNGEVVMCLVCRGLDVTEIVPGSRSLHNRCGICGEHHVFRWLRTDADKQAEAIDALKEFSAAARRFISFFEIAFPGSMESPQSSSQMAKVGSEAVRRMESAFESMLQDMTSGKQEYVYEIGNE